MFNAIEFERVDYEEGDEVSTGIVHIVPAYVVKVESFQMPGSQGLDSFIVLVEGEPEVVKGPPSEVIKRLQGRSN